MNESLFVIIVFYMLPFLIAVVLPAWAVPMLVKRSLNRKKGSLPTLVPFIGSLIALAFLANIFWELALFNKVYYEWGRIFLPYTFFWHESPTSGGSLSWLASGWRQWHLEAVWFALTEVIYMASALFAYFQNKNHSLKIIYRNILLVSVLSLTLMSLILPKLLLWAFLAVVNYAKLFT